MATFSSMPPKPSETPDSPELLSEEEMRLRAAAYAQQIYEQQLEAYRAQYAQAMAAQQARREYEQQWQAYEHACMAFQAQRSQLIPAVRVDPKTGEQIFTFREELKKIEDERLTNEISDPQEGVPASDDEASSAAWNTDAAAPDQEDSTLLEGDVEPSSDTPAEFIASSEEEVGIDPEESEKGVFEELPEAAEGAELPEGGETFPPEETAEVYAKAEEFPVFSVFLLIVCSAVFAAVGYILLSDDPRFEQQRERFFSAIGMEETETEAPAYESEDSGISF